MAGAAILMTVDGREQEASARAWVGCPPRQVRLARRKSMHPRVLSMVSRPPVSEGCICNFEPRELPVNVTIIGTGNMARGIATRVLAGGHSVTLLGTTADKAEALAAELGGDVR